MENQARGKNFLLVTGIIFIVLSVFSIFGVAISLFTINAIQGADTQTAQLMQQQLVAQNVTLDMMKISVVLSCIYVVFYMAAGILGIKNRKRTDKAQSCFVMGIILVVLVMGNAVYAVTQGKFAVWSVAISLVLPLLYLWGALKNKQTVQE